MNSLRSPSFKTNSDIVLDGHVLTFWFRSSDAGIQKMFSYRKSFACICTLGSLYAAFCFASKNQLVSFVNFTQFTHAFMFV